MRSDEAIYAQPRAVDSIEDCYFYHTVDLPGHGLMKGEWDLRGGVDSYLGYEPLKGKRVLEIGTASGYLCFEMEKRGAEVVGYDLSEEDSWDIVPYGGSITEEQLESRRKILKGIRNAWWLSRRVFNSNARMVYGTVYAVPQEIGLVDIVTFGSILLHLRDPFLALQKAASFAGETVIVTDCPRIIPRLMRLPFLPHAIRRRLMDPILYAPYFLPNPERMSPWDTWWSFSPELIIRFLNILGFTDTKLSFHTQRFAPLPRPLKLFTVVAKRGKG
jgi:hypothetical protein